VSEKCGNCKKHITKYVLLEVSEFEDSAEDSKGIRFDDTTLCIDCWTSVKQNSRILHEILARH
jgi:hypothetical protein